MKRLEYTIKSSKIKKRKKCLIFSDTHNILNAKLEDTIKNEAFDMIFIVGDIVDRHKKLTENAYPLLKLCSNYAQTFFVLGNHEKEMNFDNREKIEKTGAKLLRNEFVSFNELFIGGQDGKVDFGWIKNYEKKEGFKILLSHHPELYPNLRKYKIDLILSGHSHGGQWRFFDKAIYSPDQGFFPKYTHGQYENMIVTSGASNPRKIPRINNPIEYVVLYLCPEN
ncbi:MAG: metallophosphoesterase [Clostridia bacterium]|nr:metallophosphoesterase [Clostridia bacterium]